MPEREIVTSERPSTGFGPDGNDNPMRDLSVAVLTDLGMSEMQIANYLGVGDRQIRQSLGDMSP